MPAEDALATALEEIRGHERAATKGPWRVTQGGPGVETAWQLPEGHARAGSPVPVASMVLTVGKAEREAANARFTAGARSDVPRLLAAVGEVLKVHARTALHRLSAADGPGVCRACVDPADDTLFAAWPCATIKAITKALLGEEENDGG